MKNNKIMSINADSVSLNFIMSLIRNRLCVVKPQKSRQPKCFDL